MDKRTSSKEADALIMKILHIYHEYDYGKPELGFSNEHSNYYESLANMKDSGVDVISFPIDALLRKQGKEEVGRGLKELVFKEKPDAIFFAAGPEVLKKELIKEITEKSGAATFTWRFDDHWGFFKTGKENAFLFNYVFTTDPLAPQKYAKIGYQNSFFLPQCYNHFLYKPQNLPKKYDVSFVGRPHGVREGIIERLQKAGIKVECFGQGWPGGRVSDEEMVKIFCQSKINLNFTESSGTFWKQLALIFVKRDFERKIKFASPTKWYDNFQMLLAQKRKQIKGRIFKILGCRGFLLTGYSEGLENLYEFGKEIEGFSNFNELADKIKYYLEHDEKREKIAKAGYERSMKNHTCEVRFNEIIKIMKLRK